MKRRIIVELLNCFIVKKKKSNLAMATASDAVQQFNNRKSSQGFTLIELLVVIIVVGILTSISTASFFDFHHTQILQTAANDVVSMLSVAKSNSLSQLRSSCPLANVLNGYKVLISNSTTYTLYVVCVGTADILINTKSLPQNITFTAGSIPSEFFFAVLTGRVTITGSPTITLEGFGKTRNIEVSSTGVIK